MSIRVYNDMTRQKEEFVPLHPGKVGIYVCGVTPYNHPHIGNARTAIEPFTAVIAWCLRRTVCQIHSAIRDHKSPG